MALVFNGSTSVFQTESVGSSPICHSMGCRQDGKASDFDSDNGGATLLARRFESGHPSHKLPWTNGQVVGPSSRSRGFDSRWEHHAQHRGEWLKRSRLSRAILVRMRLCRCCVLCWNSSTGRAVLSYGTGSRFNSEFQLQLLYWLCLRLCG